MEIEVKKIIDAYRILKEVKVNSLNADSAIAVWKNLKVMRPICKDYDESIEDIKHSLITEEFQTNQTKRAELAKEGRFDDKLEKYFHDIDSKFGKFVEEQLAKTVDVELTKINEDELLKAISDAGLKFESMYVLDIITK